MRRTVYVHLAVIVIVCAVNNFRLLRDSSEYLTPDSFSYLDPARSLASGHGFARVTEPTFRVSQVPGYPPSEQAETFRTPLYPLLIALGNTIVIQHVMNVVLAAALYLFVLATLGSPSTAFGAALIFSWFPPSAHYANRIMSETLFTALLFATIVALYFAIQRRSLPLAITAGALLGLATLTRPIGLYFVIPLALVALLRGRRIVIAFVIASLVLPAAWIARNKRVSGVATLSTAGAENALFQLAAGIETTKTRSNLFRLTASQQQSGFRRPLQTEQRRLFLEAMDLARADRIDPVAANNAVRAVYLQRRAIPIIAAHPVALAELMFSGIVEMHVIEAADIGTEYGYDNSESEHRFIPVVLIAIALLIAGVWRLYSRDPTLSLLIAVTIAYFTLTAAIPEGGMRYGLVFAPVYCIGLAYGAASLFATRGPSYTKPV